jgi:hypothetical protein
MSYSMPSFLNVSVFHYSVPKNTEHYQRSNRLLVGRCTVHTAVAPCTHTKPNQAPLRRAEATLTSVAGPQNKTFKELCIHAVYIQLQCNCKR